MTRLGSSLRNRLDEPEERRKIGPFQLLRQLGRGGSAPVWLAREVYGDTELRLAAVKLFDMGSGPASSTGSLYSRAGRDRIAREARALCQIEHPNIVRFFSIAIDEPAGLLGVAMEYLTGAPLDSKLAREGARPVEEVLSLGVAIASALAAVHRAGLLHRDVKPANIVDTGGAYKLIDFGISSAADDAPRPGPKAVLVDDLPLEVDDAARSQIGGVTIDRPVGSVSGSFYPTGGTVGYMDPHCITTGAPPTAASDAYALGVVLFECVAGRHPAAFAAREGRGLETQVLDGTVRAPSLAKTGVAVPADLIRVVDALLDPDPSRRPRSLEIVAVELERMIEELAGRRRRLPPEEVGPFRGLARFESSDEGVYFGRSSDVAAALELLRSHGAVALVGPSGSGKSSLARAGILPRVLDGALGRWPERWDVALAEPGTDPRRAVLAALSEIDPSLAEEREADDLFAALREHAERSGRGVVVVIDQLEELVTQTAEPDRAWLARFLSLAGEAPALGVRALVTVRRDFLDPLLGLGTLGKVLVRGSLLVDPMTDATWADVVDQALDAYGYELEDAKLRDELLAELSGTAGAMPLVAFALAELWQRRDAITKRVTREGLRSIGGVAGALDRHAEATAARLVQSSPEAEAVLRRVLLSLTTPRGTRASRPEDEILALGPRAVTSSVLEELEKARLVVREDGGLTLAHEALLAHWSRLRAWVHEVRDDRVLAEELEIEGKRYRAAPQDVPLLKRGRLAAALELRDRGLAPLSEVSIAYVDASRRAVRRGQWLIAGATAAALGLVLFAGAAYVGAAEDRERAALEKAALEQEKASIEQQRREELEANQAELAARQDEIKRLVAAVDLAKGDEEERRRLQKELDAALKSAEESATRVASTKPVQAPAPASSPPDPPPPKKIKIQQ